MDTWSLRTRLFQIGRRWHLGAAAIFLGALLGSGAAFLLPSGYEAQAGLYVGFNADAEFLTPDDFKNWQMEELEALVLSDPVLGETLARLTEEGDDWENFSTSDLRRDLVPRWRNAGAWHLAARAGSPAAARQLAEAWRQVALEQSAAALDHAAAFLRVDEERNILLQTLVELQWQQVEILQIKRALQELQVSILPETQVDLSQKAAALMLAARIEALLGAGTTPAGLPEEDTAQAYLAWIEASLLVAESHAGFLADLERQLRPEIAALLEKWDMEKSASRGLSAFLLVEELNGDTPEVRALHSMGSWMLAGGTIGLLGWLIVHLGPTPSKKEQLP